LTAPFPTNDLAAALRTAETVQAGFLWNNEVSKRLLGPPFGGCNQAGLDREQGPENVLVSRE
jgi:betaine-aldehyde dehydrogenase